MKIPTLASVCRHHLPGIAWERLIKWYHYTRTDHEQVRHTYTYIHVHVTMHLLASFPGHFSHTSNEVRYTCIYEATKDSHESGTLHMLTARAGAGGFISDVHIRLHESWMLQVVPKWEWEQQQYKYYIGNCTQYIKYTHRGVYAYTHTYIVNLFLPQWQWQSRY